MAITKKNNLSRFINRLERYKNKINENDVLENTETIGINVMADEYSKSSTTPDAITSEVNGNVVEITAVGEKLPFSEFGTGLVGENTYEGDLPTQTLSFESPKGEQQTTQGWEYFYKNDKTKDYQKGGWYLGKNFVRGQVAEAQVFKTARRLETELASELKKRIKGD